jgi:hypothetical protein
MEPRDKEEAQPLDEGTKFTPDDEAFWELLVARLGQTDHPALCLSAESVALLKQACPPIEGDPEQSEELVAELRRTAEGVDFEATLKQRKQEPTLGSYVTFLIRREGLTASEAAKEADWEYQLLKDLEADRLPPQRIPVRPLVVLMKRLQASLALVERLVMGRVRAPRFQMVGARGSLYRSAPGALRSASESSSLAAHGEQGRRVPNPAYREEMEAARRLVEELHASWRTVDP